MMTRGFEENTVPIEQLLAESHEHDNKTTRSCLAGSFQGP